jgi:hypothetical protein
MKVGGAFEGSGNPKEELLLKVVGNDLQSDGQA